MGQKKGLTELAELLLEKEVIFSEDLEKIFGKRKVVASFEEEKKKNRAVKKEMSASKSKTKKEKHVNPKVDDSTNKKPDTK